MESHAHSEVLSRSHVVISLPYFLWNASAVMLDGMPATADLRGGGGRWAARGKR